MKEKDVCPFIELISLLSKKWVFLIIKSISDGCKSYSIIEKNLEWVNPRILSSRLSELCEKWFVEKKTVQSLSNKYTYCLTKKWESLATHIYDFVDWAEKNA